MKKPKSCAGSGPLRLRTSDSAGKRWPDPASTRRLFLTLLGERVGPSSAVALLRRMEVRADVSAHFDSTTDLVQGAESGVQRLALLGAALMVLFAVESNAADVSVKVADKEPPKQIAESIRKTLQPTAVQLLHGDTPAFEFWFGSEIPLKSKPGSAEKALDAFQETTLLGAVAVGSGQRDYKDNDIAAGLYTMRFGLQPQDGDHLGTAEYPYFAVLIPAASDTKPDGITTFKAMTKASGKDTSSNHPVVLSLRPASSDSGDLPKLNEPAADPKSVRLKVPAKAGAEKTSVVFELVYKGHGHIQ